MCLTRPPNKRTGKWWLDEPSPATSYVVRYLFVVCAAVLHEISVVLCVTSVTLRPTFWQLEHVRLQQQEYYSSLPDRSTCWSAA